MVISFRTAHTYYLSLGDSLAQGVQPNKSGVSVETNEGYPNQLYTALHMTNPTLKLVKLGCPGETTATMINGGICTDPTGSQLQQAVAFISKHHASIQLITIDIGANDLNPCVVLPTANPSQRPGPAGNRGSHLRQKRQRTRSMTNYAGVLREPFGGPPACVG